MFHAFKKDRCTTFGVDPTGNEGDKGNENSIIGLFALFTVN